MPTDDRVRPAKVRKWTEEEAEQAAAVVRNERPDVWAKLVEVERTTGDYHDVLEANIEWRLLRAMHPECELNELTDLSVKLREIRIKIVSNEGV